MSTGSRKEKKEPCTNREEVPLGGRGTTKRRGEGGGRGLVPGEKEKGELLKEGHKS